MKIGVVGTFIRDKIFPWQGEPTESIGGIFFTVAYLANLLDPTAEIVPVANVGVDAFEQISQKLAAYGNVRLQGLKLSQSPNTRVRLRYTSAQDREEITTAPMPELTANDLAILKDADAVLVNLITGVDVSLAALQTLRQESPALIYLDLHSYVLGIDPEGRRFYRRPQGWQDWACQVDVLQLNEMEALTLMGRATNHRQQALVEFGRGVLKLGPRACHLTLGERGSFLFCRRGRRIETHRVEAVAVPQVLDTIGCGDAYAAGFLAHYLANRDMVAATRFAVEVSGINSTFVGSSGIDGIRKWLKRAVPGAEFQTGLRLK